MMSEAELMTAPPTRRAAPKAKMTIYVVFLLISLFALLVGCMLLLLEINRHGGFGSVSGRVSATGRAVPTLLAAHEELRESGGYFAVAASA